MSEAELLTTTLGRGTVGPMYGRMLISVTQASGAAVAASGAWGIRLKEADAPAVFGTTFSPTADSESSTWMTWRAYSLVKSQPTGLLEISPLGWADESFVIRNPRKIETEQELVMIFENNGGAEVTVAFWVRAAILLP